MSYYKAAGRAQGNMLNYAKSYLDKETYERAVKANKKAMTGIYIYVVLVFAAMLVPLIFLGKLPKEVIVTCVLCACFSPVVFLPLYYLTFGKEWNRYVKWYTKSGRTTRFSFDADSGGKASMPDIQKILSRTEGIANAHITDIRGGRDYIKITYDNGYVMKAYGELEIGGFVVYKSSINGWQPPHDTEEFSEKDREKIILDVIAGRGPDKVNITFR